VSDETKTIVIEPFFRTREESRRMAGLQTLPERRKFPDAFALVGCVRCGTKQRPHRACGFCEPCYQWYAAVLKKVIRARERDRDER
jgi:hypothetical protein